MLNLEVIMTKCVIVWNINMTCERGGEKKTGADSESAWKKNQKFPPRLGLQNVVQMCKMHQIVPSSRYVCTRLHLRAWKILQSTVPCGKSGHSQHKKHILSVEIELRVFGSNSLSTLPLSGLSRFSVDPTLRWWRVFCAPSVAPRFLRRPVVLPQARACKMVPLRVRAQTRRLSLSSACGDGNRRRALNFLIDAALYAFTLVFFCVCLFLFLSVMKALLQSIARKGKKKTKKRTLLTFLISF